MKIFVTLFAGLLLDFSTGYEIKATGGGIVKLGQDLELSLLVNKVWDRCRWFVYEHDKHFAYCSYDLDEDTGKGEEHKCKPKNTTNIMTYTGEDSNACTITVKNVIEDYNCQWAARLDEDLSNTVINITVAREIQSISLDMDGLVAGQESTIKCNVEGGRPAPMINFAIEEPSPELKTNSLSQESDEEGIYTSVQTVTLEPKIEDHGKVVTCEAVLFDGENQPLFNKSTTTSKLNVQFPPQPTDSQSFASDLKGNVTILFQIQSNPKPDNVTWSISTFNEAENKTETLNMNVGFSDEKYEILEAENIDEISEAYKMIINDLNEADPNKEYKLMVQNSLGKQEYSFEVNVNGVNPDNGGKIPKKNMKLAILVVVVAMIAVSILCVVSIIIYKKKQIHNETTPLATLDQHVSRRINS